ncbi:HigA family addiction module antitoxin [Polynucleobacter sp. AP-Nino-20-G2]|uniref:HigA family addiction module antitoxin n=1 Tax=Polynucleobacter sp. AP-Nino-20-G2 TaxID=2576917 RepID=UPI001BFDA9EE|nr:HigA family addiction module antitoxin [Polynucleobacter sp. AP-Nino-20-G2]
MHNPPHPGLVIKEDILPALGIDPAEAADLLGIARIEFIAVIHGESEITPAMAVLIERWLGVDRGGAASVWLRQQATYNKHLR